MTDFQIHTIDSAPEGSRAGLAAAKKKFGFVPNLLGGLAEAPAALDGYLAVSEAFANSSLAAKEQQVVLLTASEYNRCHYCVAAHSTVGKRVGLTDDQLAALRDARPVDDPKLEALRRFTLTLVRERGWASPEEIEAFLAAGFTRPQVLEVILGITQKTLSNYTNHIAETPVDEPFKAFAWEPAPVG